MIGRLGRIGIVGVVFAVVGVVLIAVESLVIAGGIALTLSGVGLVVKGLLDGLMAQFGLA
jgi:hypothetical protein